MQLIVKVYLYLALGLAMVTHNKLYWNNNETELRKIIVSVTAGLFYPNIIALNILEIICKKFK